MAEKIIPSDSDPELETVASVTRSIGEMWRLIHVNSYGPLALTAVLFALVCWPTSVYHGFVLVLALALLLLLRSVARREGYVLGKNIQQAVNCAAKDCAVSKPNP